MQEVPTGEAEKLVDQSIKTAAVRSLPDIMLPLELNEASQTDYQVLSSDATPVSRPIAAAGPQCFTQIAEVSQGATAAVPPAPEHQTGFLNKATRAAAVHYEPI